MEFQHQTGRIWAESAAGALLAEVTFPEIRPGVVSIHHTFVDDSLRGQGVAGQLLQAAAAQIREAGQKAVLTCSYAQKWFPEHPEELDLVE